MAVRQKDTPTVARDGRNSKRENRAVIFAFSDDDFMMNLGAFSDDDFLMNMGAFSDDDLLIIMGAFSDDDL